MSNLVMANCGVSVEFEGGDYIDFDGQLASFKAASEADIHEENVIGKNFPLHTMIGMKGSVDITGLRMRNPGAGRSFLREVHVDDLSDAFFVVMHHGGALMGPCGYIKVKSGDVMDGDGVFKLDATALGENKPDFEFFRYGTLIPVSPNSARNSWKGVGSGAYPNPVVNQLAVINVVAPGNLTQLKIEYRKDTVTWELSAKKSGANVIAGITRGKMLNTTTEPHAPIATADLTGGTNRQWRVVTTPSNPNAQAKFYVGLIHLFS